MVLGQSERDEGIMVQVIQCAGSRKPKGTLLAYRAVDVSGGCMKVPSYLIMLVKTVLGPKPNS